MAMNESFKTVSMMGLGYIGLPTAAVLASRGVDVIGVDINQNVVDTINQGHIHIVEPDLEALVHEVVHTGKLRAVAKPESADVFLIAVPTPFKGNHEPDLSYVEAAARSIAPVLRKNNLVILESTSPVGSTQSVAELLAECRPDLAFPHQAGEAADINMAYCPERVLPGKVIYELIENDRIVGGMTPLCATRAAKFYSTFVKGECIITNARTAEMCKLTENSFRDVNIAFANELSFICDELNINVWELIRLANHHPRVKILQPGPGVGGHCIAVDPWFIVDKSPKTARLIRTAREVNDLKPYYVIDKVKVAAAKFRNPVIACLGLAFKADIDDLRESPSLEIVQHLNKLNLGSLYVSEPHISELPPSLLGNNVSLVEANVAIEKADIVLLLVNHKAFKEIGIDELVGKEVIDTRGLWAR
jgi:UDP-N-acetyl-D-mannosaminuronic acid dehydrogenase